MQVYELTVLVDATSVDDAEAVRQAIRAELASRSWSEHEDVAFRWPDNDDGLFEFTVLARMANADLADRLRHALVACYQACRMRGTLPQADVIFGQFAEKLNAYTQCGDCQAPLGEQHCPTCGLGRGAVRVQHML